MKKTCFLLLCALLLGVAPATSADEGGFFDGLAGLFAQWLESVAGTGDPYGPQYPPNGQPSDGSAIGPEYPPHGQPASDGLPPKSSPATGGEPEYGPEYPPNG